MAKPALKQFKEFANDIMADAIKLLYDNKGLEFDFCRGAGEAGEELGGERRIFCDCYYSCPDGYLTYYRIHDTILKKPDEFLKSVAMPPKQFAELCSLKSKLGEYGFAVAVVATAIYFQGKIFGHLKNMD